MATVLLDMMPGALIFDLDGTLIDSVPQVALAINATLAELGRPALPLNEVRGIVGDGAQATLERAFSATGGTEKINIGAMVERYLAHYLANPASHTAIFPDVIEILTLFQAAGKVMGICTNKPSLTTHPVLRALGLRRYFAAVVTADDTRFRKPDGRHILDTLTAMGAGHSDAIFVGDSSTDLAAAHAAGIPAILVTYGYGHPAAEALPAAARIRHFRELPAALKAISR